jgi:hypothetical protein
LMLVNQKVAHAQQKYNINMLVVVS